ncbi:hypothetical protein DFAR_3690017 [Desulfarculales bacterium]
MQSSRLPLIHLAHLNLFQHHCNVIARMPWRSCPDHRTKQVKAPWACESSRFTLLFEQAAMTLMREMPVLAAAHIIAVRDTRLWRVPSSTWPRPYPK